MGLRFASSALLSVAAAFAAERVDFNRDVRPILSDKCYTCHGPDAANRKSKLRLDTEEGSKVELNGGRKAIIPGDPAASELIKRITAEHKGLRMPPVASGRSLSTAQIETLQRWIEQGAVWQKHWSLIPPTRPAVPAVQDASWVRNPIDAFIAQRLENEGLKPTAQASPEVLIRRLTLDLTGLPPSPAEVDAFVSDHSPEAYEKLVDRLLSSPRYGERMAAKWLDGARYADTNGYQTDAERYMWRWRDWVIEAFNRNLSFDRFTVEQLAGDLLPHPTLDQQIATGFNRNHRGNGEGGIIPEEYAVEYVADRVETTSTVWMGLTLGCARCHDHKYDPLTQKDFYSVFAFFNNIPEKGKANKYGNSPPLIPAPTRSQQLELQKLDQRAELAGREFAALQSKAEQGQAAWESSLAPGSDWEDSRDRVALPAGLTGDYDGSRIGDAGDLAPFGFLDRFTLSLQAELKTRDAALLTRAKDEAEEAGYGLYVKDGRVQLNLVLRWLDDALRVETEETLEPGKQHHIAATYDGSRQADGVRIYLDGKPAKIRVLLDELNQTFTVKEPLRVGAGAGMPQFRGTVARVAVFHRALTPKEIAVLAERHDLSQIAKIAPASRTAAQSSKLRQAFLESPAAPEVQAAWARLREALAAKDKFLQAIPTVMVMEERTTPRDTFVLARGAYDRPGDKVQAATPGALLPMDPAWPRNRLGFARWLVDRQNPLTARVAVNRYWQMYFGAGLVRTVEDFGSQGEWPSHPALLDWLAVEFMDSGWNVKSLQKKIVMSSTYRQSSHVTPEMLARDPENRLLSRSPRLRLPAEMVRDQALAASGLLVEKLGGPSVKPYQPAGLWKELSGGEDYKQDSGDKLYRRSLYTYWKRAAPPPSLMNFDAAGRETCTVRQSRTNTPLQALDLMNDVTYVEASRMLAQHSLLSSPAQAQARIAAMFRNVLARDPKPAELEVLLSAYHRNLDRFRTQPAAAARILKEGEAAVDPTLDKAELAAAALTASLIFNLDEAVNRP